MITHPNVKVNLGLNVLRKREDGFHDLETLFVPYFGISDTLEIVVGDDYSRTLAGMIEKYGSKSASDDKPQFLQTVSDDGKVMITIARAEGVDWDPLKDLTVKAYNLLSKDFDLPSIKIFLEKTSPVGAGLGGGSSDASFALKMLNEMFCLKLDDMTLANYASSLGSDCAFFIYNSPMFGTGRGEILTPYKLDDIDYGQGNNNCLYELQVVIPEGISVSTAQAYGGIKPNEPEIRLSEQLKYPVDTWKDKVKNDFETTVFAIHPELNLIKSSLYESGAIYASMSGSGSALFGIYSK